MPDAPGSYQYDLICIGSGPAGQRGAVQAAKLGKRVAVIERGHCLGGVCLNTGTVPSKTFREAVLQFLTHAPTGSRPDAQLLLSRVEEVVRREQEVVENQLRRNDVVLVWGEATFKDPHTAIANTEHGVETLTSEKFLVACGTRPAPPPGVTTDGQVVITSDEILALKKLPKTLAVVGAGVVGIEYACMFARLGIAVTLVDKREVPLDFVDREIVDELMHQMRNEKVTFRMGEAVQSVEIVAGQTRRAAILLESGKRIVSDMVLYSAGRIGNTDKLNIGVTGLEQDDRGRIKVNENYQTSVPHIYAAGDVIGYPSLAATSAEQGRRAACHAFGVHAGPMEPHFPIGIYAIPEISVVGANEQELTKQKVPYEIGIARYREIARGQILGDDTGLLKMIFHREDRRLLGVHAIGTSATELIHIGQAVIGLGGGLDYFLKTVFNYPTLAECYKVAALDAANRLAR